jgi:DNA-binding NarL/FixJ family response regulator
MSDARCLIADDHPALTSAISAYLAESGFEIVGPAVDGRGAVELVAAETPEVALVDYRMPRLSGTELIRAVKEASPDTAIAVYTADADETLAEEAFEAGANAVILKAAPLGDLVRALQAVLAGNSYLDPALHRLTQPASRLTERELDVLRLLAEGFPHEEIGKTLGISSETVRTHLRKASDRLGASTRTHAVATALRMGLIT